MEFMYPLGAEGFVALSMVDVDTGYGACIGVMHKGGSDSYSVTWALAFLFEVGHMDIVLQVDQEPSLVDLAKKVAGQYTGKVALKETPRSSSASNGSVERFHQSVQSMARILMVDFQLKYDQTLTKKDVTTPWLLRHAGFFYTWYQVPNAGLTIFQKLKEVPYSSAIVPFAETVYAKSETKERNKIAVDWVTAIEAR